MDRKNQLKYILQMQMAQMLYGRNGVDALVKTCSVVAVILMFINIFFNNTVLYFMWVGLAAYAIFRIISKNIPKRHAENRKFLEVTSLPRKRVNFMKMQWRDRSTSRYYICAKCNQQIRVPRGKGRIEIRCPRCSNKFIKKT
ncbi:hypothetical protein SAMN04487770_11958 [Butyrivibrio sp. ob235]|uniref:hypothetical protein n=1 Tax=Butyrivibrio sp. ob235 TaxID=1761780 RepID=UPI0008BE8694|nr:hypothetical protein [Butyrivibrio sp. ob235]SEL86425.1 hypothetical protein SAMN04487770_11958 [Butyrivibrio sp. ob235]